MVRYSPGCRQLDTAGRQTAAPLRWRGHGAFELATRGRPHLGAGLDVYEPSSDTFQRDPAGLGGQIVSAIYQGGSGVLWLGTRGSGVYRFDPTSRQLTNYRHDADNPRSLSSNSVQKIIGDRSG